jgi:hypothetical protein
MRLRKRGNNLPACFRVPNEDSLRASPSLFRYEVPLPYARTCPKNSDTEALNLRLTQSCLYHSQWGVSLVQSCISIGPHSILIKHTTTSPRHSTSKPLYFQESTLMMDETPMVAMLFSFWRSTSNQELYIRRGSSYKNFGQKPAVV